MLNAKIDAITHIGPRQAAQCEDGYLAARMKKSVFKVLATLNKALLPSFSKQGLNLAEASKFQLLIFGWRLYVTMRATD